MNNIISNIINKLNGDQIKIILNSGETAEDFVEHVFDEYTEKIENKRTSFNEEELFDLVLEYINSLKEIQELIDIELSNIENSNFIKVRAFLSDRTEMYREISIPTYAPFSEFAYSVLASFNCNLGKEYKIQYKNKEFYPEYLYYDKPNKCLNAQEEFIDDFNVKPGEKIKIIYDNDWKFIVKILKIGPRTNEIEITPLLLDVNGYDILDGKKHIFDLLMNDDLDSVKVYCRSKKQYETVIKYYNNKEMELSQEEYEKRIDNLRKFYEPDDYDDILDDYECDEFDDVDIDDESDSDDLGKSQFVKDREKRNERLASLSHVKEYLRIKEIFENVLLKANKFLDIHKEYYFNMLNKMLKDDKKELSTTLRFESLELKEKDFDDIMSCILYPHTKHFESVAERLKKDRIFNGEEAKILDSMIKSKIGFYHIKGYDFDNGYIYLKETKTGEEIKAIDLNLSFGLNYMDEKLYALLRVFEYNKVKFCYNAVMLTDDDEVQHFIELYNRNKYKPIELYFLTLIIKNKQGIFN